MNTCRTIITLLALFAFFEQGRAGEFYAGLVLSGGFTGTYMEIPAGESWISNPEKNGSQEWLGHTEGADAGLHWCPGLFSIVSFQTTLGYAQRRMFLPEQYYPAASYVKEHCLRGEILSRWWVERLFKGPGLAAGFRINYVAGGNVVIGSRTIQYNSSMRGAEYYFVAGIAQCRRFALGKLKLAIPVEIMCAIDLSAHDTRIFELAIRVAMLKRIGMSAGEAR